jgi:hypothetical protein
VDAVPAVADRDLRRAAADVAHGDRIAQHRRRRDRSLPGELTLLPRGEHAHDLTGGARNGCHELVRVGGLAPGRGDEDVQSRGPELPRHRGEATCLLGGFVELLTPDAAGALDLGSEAEVRPGLAHRLCAVPGPLGDEEPPGVRADVDDPNAH